MTDPIVLVPAAGRGQRFRDAGYDVIKPMIMFRLAEDHVFSDKRQMLVHACHGTLGWKKIIGLPADEAAKVTQASAGFAEIVGVPPNGGQLDTIETLLSHVRDPQQPILVLNSDVSFRNGVLPIFCHFVEKIDADAGSVVVWREDIDSYSYVDDVGVFERARERMSFGSSRWALAGAYWFANKKILQDAILVEKNAPTPTFNGELYLSSALSHITGYKVSFPIADENYLEFGTPEKLQKILDRKV